MVDYDQAVKLQFDADVLLIVVRAYEDGRASEERSEALRERLSDEFEEKSEPSSKESREEMSDEDFWRNAAKDAKARMRVEKTRRRVETTRMRAEIDEALHELRESVDELQDMLAEEQRATLAKKVRVQTITDAFNGIKKAYKAACNADGDFETGLRTRQCIARGRALLAERKITPRIRLKTLVLMTKMAPDYDKALGFHRRVDCMLRVARERQTQGKGADTDDALDKLEALVEKLRAQISWQTKLKKIIWKG
jgi:hypothetical protein